MKIDEILIGKILFSGIVLAAIFVGFGGSLYLLRDGSEPYQSIVNKDIQFSLRDLAVGVIEKSPHAYILLGVMILIFTQLVRVVFAAWMFYVNQETILMLVSIFVLLVLCASLFINI